MRFVKLFAGLGNQLFQYSYGLCLRAAGEKVRFILSPEPGCLTDVFDLTDDSILESSNSLASTLTKAWAKYVRGSYEVGFFQEIRYAAKALELCTFEFRRQDAYSESPWSGLVGGDNAVSLHVRGGDYLSEGARGSYGSVCGPEYYARAVEALSGFLREPELFVFTDDTARSESLLGGIGREYQIVRDEAFVDDPGFHLFLMSRCKYHVIANSTYSWWGAFLCSGDNRATVCPDRWTADGTVDMDRLVPDSWIRIDTEAS